MSLNVVFEVGLGLSLIYLLLALICTAVNEMIAGVLALRAKTLTRGLREILSDPDGQQLFKDVANHPLVRSAFELSGKRGSSYLSAHTFTTALLDVIAAKAPVDHQERAPEAETTAPGDPAVPALPATILLGIDAIQDATAHGILKALANQAAGDVNQFRTSVAAWFDDAMDRLSGVYKRRAQLILLGLALAVSIAFDADTVEVARTLWRDAPLRAEIAAAAADVAALEKLDATYPELREQLLQFPIGWPLEPVGMPKILGAPFWFDMLRRVNAIRSAGPKPQRGLPVEPDQRSE